MMQRAALRVKRNLLFQGLFPLFLSDLISATCGLQAVIFLWKNQFRPDMFWLQSRTSFRIIPASVPTQMSSAEAAAKTARWPSAR